MAPPTNKSNLLNRLASLYQGTLVWNGSSSAQSTNASQRRQEALQLLRSSTPKPPRSNAEPKPREPRPRGRPKALSWVEERKIATFIMLRKRDRRLVKNAVSDAQEKFGLSRASIYRILDTHEAGAKHMARAIFQARNKRFRPVIDVNYKMRPIDFSDWGPDRY